MAKPKENANLEPKEVETFPVEQVETFPANEETKAVIDGWWVADQRYAKCETKQEASELFKACFRFNPESIEPATRYPMPGESYLFQSHQGPMYGNG